MGTIVLRVTIAIAVIGVIGAGGYMLLQRDTVIQSTDSEAPPAVVQEPPTVVVAPNEPVRPQPQRRSRDLKPVPHDYTPLR
jgi:hypothetical protein